MVPMVINALDPWSCFLIYCIKPITSFSEDFAVLSHLIQYYEISTFQAELNWTITSQII